MKTRTNGRRLALIGLVLIVLGVTMICYPAYTVSQAVEELPEAEDVGLPDGYYQIVGFDGDLGFDVEWTSKDITGKAINQYYCEYEYKFRCVDGYDVKPPPVGRYCVKSGNQKLDCDSPIPGIQKAADYQEIRWVENGIKNCWSFMPILKKCPPCPVCED